MKFAKELEREAVPEWRIKYLNYKQGKKHIKAVGRALARANGTPRGLGQLRTGTFASPATPRQPFTRENTALNSATIPSVAAVAPPRSIPTPRSRAAENESLTDSGDNRHYGSFVNTPTEPSPLAGETKHAEFQLPAPALKVHDHESDLSGSPATIGPSEAMRRNIERIDPRRTSSASVVSTIASPDVNNSTKKPSGSGAQDSPSHLRRLFTHQSTAKSDRRVDINMQNFDLVKEREREFFDFLDSELEKVESFYKMKEEQAGQRLDILRVQLHEMRNRRIQEMADERAREENPQKKGTHDSANGKLNGFMDPIKSKIFPIGPNTKALQKMNTTPNINGGVVGDAERDYIRRPTHHEVSYRTAKRKLKLALQEFYRGLELLKSYAMLNRTAFRKLNKKYDKAVNARPPYRYLNEKVNQSWFVNSDVLEGHIRTVEDLYARYFERGNHKLAVGKLRSLNKKPEDQSIGMFQNGLLIGTGAVFAIQGLIYGAQLLYDDDDDDEVRVRTSYLMQIYGGYFLMLYLFSLFCIDCSIWNQNKVNYPFIFEFDQRHHLDWRELAQFPSFFFLVLGLFMWVNFSRYGNPDMYIYYPVILIFFTIVILFFPAPALFYKSRRWFAYSHWRLLLAGLYPVEFRDFFLGDIYCSLTYATANIELFFCLYANYWQNPVQCNSSHSRALGFLTALPPIWRFLQCLRRYKDTRNVFPHLVNGGKYTATIIAAVMLSLYRIHDSNLHLALFITFSTINSIYCSFWDLFMDFSLLQPNSRHWCLRDILALKRRWLYYFIMVVDPILRFAWVFYAIFTHNTQHSTIVSFMVAFMEVTRRGMWTLFRVENEHCGNVSQYKASRDVPLPYRIEPLIARASMDSTVASHQPDDTAGAASLETPSRHGTAESTAVSAGQAEEGLSRRRTGGVAPPPPPKRTFSRMLAEAHKQDFEKKRRPLEQTSEDPAAELGQSDDEDDADEAVSLLEMSDAEDLARASSSSRYR